MTPQRKGRLRGGKTIKPRKTIPVVESLEERCLLNAAPTAWVEVVPNDTSFKSQYALNNTGQTGGKIDADIDAVEAWDMTTGSLKSVVGIVDTGIDYRHVDLYRNIWINQKEIPSSIRNNLSDLDGDGLITFWDLNNSRNQGTGKIRDLNSNGYIDGGDLLRPVTQGGWANGKSDDGDKYVDDLIGWDFLNNDNDPYDDNGHGTHVAGTVGATGNNGVGVAGVNWKVQMMALKFLGANGSGSVEGAIRALDYAVKHGAFVSNHSWSMGDYVWKPLRDAIARAQAAGHIFVAAAGNGGSDGKGDNNDIKPNYPASFGLANILAVAATGHTDGLASFSNYGVQSVDLGAPGLGILSTYPGNRYQTMGGTSMATPHVTGVVALVHSLHPDWGHAKVIQQILTSVDPLSSLRGKTVTGGRLNAGKAVASVQRDLAGAFVLDLSSGTTGSNPVQSVRVTFSEPIDPASFTARDVRLTGPRGAINIKGIQPVEGSGNTQFDLVFAVQSRAGDYRVKIGPKIRDLAGYRLDGDHDGKYGEPTQDRYVDRFTIAHDYTFSLPSAANVHDNQTTYFTLNVGRDLHIAEVSVALVLTHPDLSQLRIELRGPDGTQVVLTNRGAAGNSFLWTTFTDAAILTLAQGTTPYRDGFRPEESLGAFAGNNARGAWELIVTDAVAGQGGRLYQLRLSIEEGPGLSSIASAQAAPVETSSDRTDRPLIGQFFTSLRNRDETPSVRSSWRFEAGSTPGSNESKQSCMGSVGTSIPLIPVRVADKADSPKAMPSVEELMDFFALSERES